MGKYAVIVGVEGNLKLNQNSSTARLCKQTLQRAGFASNDMTILTNKRATRVNVEGAIVEITEKATPEDTLVFSYTGHGTDTGILLYPIGVNHSTLKGWLDGWVSMKQLVIVDSCESGGIVVPGADGITLAAPNRIVVASASEQGSAFVNKHYTAFGEYFFPRLQEGYSVQECAHYMIDDYGEPFYL